MNAASATQPSETRRRSRRSWPVRLRRAVLVVGTALAVAVGGMVVVYCFPPSGDPTDADLVYVIGPATGTRMDVAQSIIHSTGREDLLISVSAGNTTKLAAAQMPACSEPHVICEHPIPSTTKGEALLLNEYAKTHEVHKVVVLTVTPHVARTRYIFARCSPDIDVQVIPVDEHLRFEDWVHQFAYQTGAFVKAIATPCASDDG
ncbi:YdcF family protein [Microbacterium sp. SORGH_AS_0862]|uniref:YdcF family protein n=1 Tax=Microbacterium sp. SORGH_AS_0862 TaxID=3041789 RepID=UPI00278CD695|nr:YdcF family protein [Microbacterium sp. SORGH_AS_0862]MDQ1204484.1 hypothetical protein [Microbacterium sp. SORGH_AS_0862]